MMNDKIKSILIRLLKGFIAGAVATLATAVAVLNNVHTWTDLYTAFSMLALSAMIGGVTGLVLAAEKWASWQD